MSVEDASCTEAWVKVSLADANEPRTIAIQRDGQQVLSAQMTTMDSLFVVEGLLPSRTYSFVSQRLSGTTVIDVSAAVQATTMDTTSHDFTWHIDTLGVTASTLYDVAIINDTLAYAVGEMYLRDSTGQIDPLFYNLARWNGQEWMCQRILYNGSPFATRWILAFGGNDIWINEHTHWDGNTWSFSSIGNPLFDGVRTTKAWGVSNRDFYVVGDGGFIAHYNGSTWQRLESGTGLPIMDVYGALTPKATNREILALASNGNGPTGSKVLSIENGIVRALPSSGISWGTDAIWFLAERRYVVVGDGLWRTTSREAVWGKDSTVAPIYMTCVDGLGLNDMAVGGAFWFLLHYNGQTWRSYFPFASGSFTAIAMRGNSIMAVGGIGSRAVVARGTR